MFGGLVAVGGELGGTVTSGGQHSPEQPVIITATITTGRRDCFSLTHLLFLAWTGGRV